MPDELMVAVAFTPNNRVVHSFTLNTEFWLSEIELNGESNDLCLYQGRPETTPYILFFNMARLGAGTIRNLVEQPDAPVGLGPDDTIQTVSYKEKIYIWLPTGDYTIDMVNFRCRGETGYLRLFGEEPRWRDPFSPFFREGPEPEEEHPRRGDSFTPPVEDTSRPSPRVPDGTGSDEPDIDRFGTERHTETRGESHVPILNLPRRRPR
jgi:hypothetical protein